MTTQYTTKINSMYTVNAPKQGFVVNVLFTVSGTDGTNTASIDGNINFTPVNDQKDYVPYSSLTQAEVIGWVQTALGEQGIANYEANVQGQINSLENPPVSPSNTPLPWSN